jgi:hypothetical protein
MVSDLGPVCADVITIWASLHAKNSERRAILHGFATVANVCVMIVLVLSLANASVSDS